MVGSARAAQGGAGMVGSVRAAQGGTGMAEGVRAARRRGAHSLALGLLLRHSARSRGIQNLPGSERSTGISGCCDCAQHDGWFVRHRKGVRAW